MNPDCPKCKGTMVERVSIHGKFWGCSSYPRCRGTQPFENMSPGWMKKLAKETLDRCLPTLTKAQLRAEKIWRVGLRDMYGMIYGE